jgi:oligopeptide transport system permease protein
METRRTDLTPQAFEQIEAGSQDNERISGPPVGFWKDAWGRLKKNRGAIVGLVVILILMVLSVIGPLLTLYGPYEQDLTRSFTEPFTGSHWFGTDDFGRDLWTRLWEGTRISLYIAFLATFLDLVVGVTYGAISGIFGGRTDDVMQRGVEILNGIPYLIVVILAMLVFPPGIITITIALVLVGWTNMSRIVRSRILQLKEQEFTLASRSLGAGRLRLVTKHLLPNSFGPILINLMFTIPYAIFAEAFLSFIGLGIQPPDASLGALISDGYKQLRFHPYLLWYPAIVFSLLMICFNLLADGLRDALDPRMRK